LRPIFSLGYDLIQFPDKPKPSPSPLQFVEMSARMGRVFDPNLDLSRPWDCRITPDDKSMFMNSCQYPRASGYVAIVVAMLACLTAGPARAAFILDTFDQTTLPGGRVARTTASGVGTMAQGETGLSGTIGGIRESILDLQSFTGSPSPLASISFTVRPTSSDLLFASTTNVNGALTLQYDGTGGAGGNLNADISNDLGLSIRFLSNDQALPVTLTLFDGVVTSSRTLNQAAVPQTAPANLTFPYSDPAFASLNLTSIDSFTVLFDPATARGFRVDSLESVSVVVPEPSSMLLFGIGGLGAFGIFHCRRTKQPRGCPRSARGVPAPGCTRRPG
jgi:hypothetical protein